MYNQRIPFKNFYRWRAHLWWNRRQSIAGKAWQFSWEQARQGLRAISAQHSAPSLADHRHQFFVGTFWEQGSGRASYSRVIKPRMTKKFPPRFLAEMTTKICWKLNCTPVEITANYGLCSNWHSSWFSTGPAEVHIYGVFAKLPPLFEQQESHTTLPSIFSAENIFTILQNKRKKNSK